MLKLKSWQKLNGFRKGVCISNFRWNLQAGHSNNFSRIWKAKLIAVGKFPDDSAT